MSGQISRDPTPWGVHCVGTDIGVGFLVCNQGDIIYLTESEYDRQLSLPDAKWRCPLCGRDAWWDDGNFERKTSNRGDL